MVVLEAAFKGNTVPVLPRSKSVLLLGLHFVAIPDIPSFIFSAYRDKVVPFAYVKVKSLCLYEGSSCPYGL
jgi:hypothetical protein